MKYTDKLTTDPVQAQQGMAGAQLRGSALYREADFDEQWFRDAEEDIAKETDRAEVLSVVAQMIFADALNHVPVRTGTLIRSGFLDLYDTYACIGFTAPYAEYVERLDRNVHTDGTARFLKNAVMRFIEEEPIIVFGTDHSVLTYIFIRG